MEGSYTLEGPFRKDPALQGWVGIHHVLKLPCFSCGSDCGAGVVLPEKGVGVPSMAGGFFLPNFSPSFARGSLKRF